MLHNKYAVSAIFIAANNIDKCTTKALIAHGADIDQKIILGNDESNMFMATPLISTVRFNNDQAVEMLLNLGANPDPLDAKGRRLIDHPLIFQEGKTTERTKRI